MFKLMEQIAFEITKKFHASFTYTQLNNGIGFYSFDNKQYDEAFYLRITPDSIEVDVDLFRFNPCATTNHIELIGKRKMQSFLHEALFLLQTSDAWEEFVKSLYCLNEFSFK